jgi:hypothetical protein
MIASIDEITGAVGKVVAARLPDRAGQSYRLLFRTYGKNAVLGGIEPVTAPSHELGLVIEAVADTQELANAVCSIARSTLLHYGYEGRIATAGNLAFPFSPSDVAMGEAFEFSLYHVMTLGDSARLFHPRFETIGAGIAEERQ